MSFAYEPGGVVTNATNAEIFTRDGGNDQAGKCVRCGERANTTQHRVHGNRADRRPSNLLSACMGPGTRDCHGYMEAHRRESRTWGWEVHKAHRDRTATLAAWFEVGPEGRGWYLLADDLTYKLVEPG